MSGWADVAEGSDSAKGNNSVRRTEPALADVSERECTAESGWASQIQCESSPPAQRGDDRPDSQIRSPMSQSPGLEKDLEELIASHQRQPMSRTATDPAPAEPNSCRKVPVAFSTRRQSPGVLVR